MAVGNRCADHVTPLYPQKLALTSPTAGGRSVGTVRSRTKVTEFFFFLNFTEICRVVAAPMHADRRAYGRTDTTKIVGTLCDYANASTKEEGSDYKCLTYP